MQDKKYLVQFARRPKKHFYVDPNLNTYHDTLTEALKEIPRTAKHEFYAATIFRKSVMRNGGWINLWATHKGFRDKALTPDEREIAKAYNNGGL